MKRRIISPPVLLLLCVPLFSCAINSAGIVIESWPKDQITVNSRILGHRLKVVDRTTAVQPNSLLQAQVTVQNVTRRDAQIEYRFRWIDGNGMELDTPMTTWLAASLPVAGKVSLKAMAPCAAATAYIMDIRYTNPSTRW